MASAFESYLVQNVPAYLNATPEQQAKALPILRDNASKLGTDALRAAQQDTSTLSAIAATTGRNLLGYANLPFVATGSQAPEWITQGLEYTKNPRFQAELPTGDTLLDKAGYLGRSLGLELGGGIIDPANLIPIAGLSKLNKAKSALAEAGTALAKGEQLTPEMYQAAREAEKLGGFKYETPTSGGIHTVEYAPSALAKAGEVFAKNAPIGGALSAVQSYGVNNGEVNPMEVLAGAAVYGGLGAVLGGLAQRSLTKMAQSEMPKIDKAITGLKSDVNIAPEIPQIGWKPNVNMGDITPLSEAIPEPKQIGYQNWTTPNESAIAKYNAEAKGVDMPYAPEYSMERPAYDMSGNEKVVRQTVAEELRTLTKDEKAIYDKKLATFGEADANMKLQLIDNIKGRNQGKEILNPEAPEALVTPEEKINVNTPEAKRAEAVAMTMPEAPKGEVVYHTGADLSQGIEPNLFTHTKENYADGFAGSKEGFTNKIEIAPDARVKEVSNVSRVTEPQMAKASEKYDVIRDKLGGTLILNPDKARVIESMPTVPRETLAPEINTTVAEVTPKISTVKELEDLSSDKQWLKDRAMQYQYGFKLDYLKKLGYGEKEADKIIMGNNDFNLAWVDKKGNIESWTKDNTPQQGVPDGLQVKETTKKIADAYVDSTPKVVDTVEPLDIMPRVQEYVPPKIATDRIAEINNMIFTDKFGNKMTFNEAKQHNLTSTFNGDEIRGIKALRDELRQAEDYIANQKKEFGRREATIEEKALTDKEIGEMSYTDKIDKLASMVC